MRKATRFCDTCWRTRDADLSWIMVLVVIPMMLTSGGDMVQGLSVPAALVIALLVHELGHALCAAALRFPIIKVQFGGGRSLLERHVGPVQVVVARRLTRGYTAYKVVDRVMLRARMMAVDVSGAAANIALAVAAARWAPGRVGVPFALMNGFFAFTALWPFFRGQHNDGRNLVGRASCPRWMIDGSLLYEQFETTARHMAEGELDAALAASEEALRLRPGNQLALMNHGAALLELGRADEARQICQGLLEVVRIKPLRANLLNNLAYANLLIGHPDLLTEADEASARALAGRENPAYLDTRAWALIETGQIAAGVRLAHRALTYSTGRARAHTQCVLALGAARSGDTDQAQNFLAAAADVLPDDDPVLRRIRRSVGDLPVAQLVEP